MSGPDNPSSSAPDNSSSSGTNPTYGSALPPPSASGYVPPPANGPPFSPANPYGGAGAAGGSGPVGPAGRSGGSTGVPIVVWFLLGLFLIAGAVAAYFVTRGEDVAQQPPATAAPTLPTVPTVPTAPPSAVTEPPARDDVASVDPAAPASTAPPAAIVTVPATQAPPTTEAVAAPPSTTAPVAADSAVPGSVPSDSAESSPDDPAAAAAVNLPDGRYTVGTDIAPGAYRVGFELEGDFDIYRWTIMDSDGFLHDLDLGIGGWGLMVVPDDPGATVEFEGGALSVDTTGPVDPNDYDKGTYLVGYDIEPGNYQLSGDSVSFTRYDEEMVSIASASAGSEEGLELTVKPTDYAVKIEGQLTTVG